MDGMIDIMDALVVRRMDAERMRPGPVLRKAPRPRIARAEAASVPRRVRPSDLSLRQERLELLRRREAARCAAGGRKFRHGVRKAFLHTACRDRLMRASFSFSTRSRATPLRWVSNKSGSYSIASAVARRFSRGSMPERAGSNKGGLSTAIGAARGDFARFGVYASIKPMGFQFQIRVLVEFRPRLPGSSRTKMMLTPEPWRWPSNSPFHTTGSSVQ